MKQQRMQHVFMEEIPAVMEQGVLYVSIECATAIHLCACGCGQQIVTPLSPTDWSLTFNGEHVSLDHSIGNGSLPCGSHYFIRHDTVAWAKDLSKADSERSRARDRRSKSTYFAKQKSPELTSDRPADTGDLSEVVRQPAGASSTDDHPRTSKGWKSWLRQCLGRFRR